MRRYAWGVGRWGCLRILAADRIGRGKGPILLCDAPLLVFLPGSRTRICLEKRKGEGLVNSARRPPRPGGQRRS